MRRFGGVTLAAVLGSLMWVVVASGVQPYETYETAVTTDGPAAQFRFDDAAGSTTVADSAGSFSATNTGITLGGAGPFGGSKSGTLGGEAYATLPSSPLVSATAFTVEAWVNWTGGASYKQPVFDFGSSSTNYIYLTPASSLTEHTMLLEIHTTAGTIAKVTTTKLPEKVWEYVVATETSTGTLTLYLNGAEVAHTTGAAINPSSLGSSPSDYLGKSLVSGEPDFKGSLSNVAFYTKALSAERILAHYHDAEFPVNTVLPTISGTAKEGETLKAKEGTWTGLAPITYTYQWQRCNEKGESCATIAAATSSTYVVAQEDIGSTLRVLVTGKNVAGSSTATSVQTAKVAARAPSNTALPVISGEAKEGQLVSVSTGSWTGTPPLSYTYQWENCNEKGESCAQIKGATASTYRVASGEAGKTLRAIVTAENAGGKASATSAPSVIVKTGPPLNTEAPKVTGEIKEGKVLSASPGVWVGTAPITYAYQWQDCNWLGGECQNIEGATGQTYVLGAGDKSLTVRVRVTASNTVGSVLASSAVGGEVLAGAPSLLEAPVITGVTSVGYVLRAVGGMWGGSEPQLAYQWQRCNEAGEACVSIVGATSNEYVLSEEDWTSTLRVLEGSADTLGSVVAASPVTRLIERTSTIENSAPPVLSGIAQNGKTLSVSTGGWVGTGTMEYAYQWERCNAWGRSCKPIEGATGQTYVLGSADVGSTVRAYVTAFSTLQPRVGLATSATSVVAAVGAPVDSALPTVAGTGLVGEVMTSTIGVWSSEGTLSYTYQWERCNSYGEKCVSISGVTSSGYTLASADAGSTVRLNVKATASGTSTKAISTPISVVATGLADVTAPSVSGSQRAGETLTANTGIWTGSGSITYGFQWERCNEKGESCTNITGAISAPYTPVAADVGHALVVMVTATGPSGKSSLASPATRPISGPPTEPINVLEPTIEGNATEGQTLTALPGSWLGTEPISYSYQWQRCNPYGEECSNITEATSSTYVLAKADVGQTLRVAVRAKNEIASTTATSNQTEAIGKPGPPANTEAPSIRGTLQLSQTLFANNGTWSGSRPLTFYYHWERCNEKGEACVAIAGATSSSYTLASADVGSSLRLKLTASNTLGSSAVFSATTAVIAGSSETSSETAIELAQVTDPSVIAQATSVGLEEETIKPVVIDSGEALSSEATLTGSSASKETPGEFAVSTPNGEVSLAPLGTAANAASTPTIVNGSAAVFAGTNRETDTITRPEPLGATTLLQLRSSQAPTSFSWEVKIGAEQELQTLANGSVAVVEKEASSYLEGELPSELLEGPGKETAAETNEHPFGSESAEEAFGGSIEEVGELEHLQAAKTTATTPQAPKSGELHPQETQPAFEAATSALGYAETHAPGKTLMVIQPPTVMDAAGHTTPATLSVEGNTITMSITPSKESVYPMTAAVAVSATSHKKAAPGPEARRGLADEQKSAFSESEHEGKAVQEFDPRLKGHMKVESARLIIDYNASPHSLILHEWLEAVQAAHLKPLITFRACVKEAPSYKEPSLRVPCPESPAPTSSTFPGYYYNHVYSLMKELIKDGVRTFGAWNEPDEHSNPLHHYPERAGLLWGEAQHAVEKLGCAHHCVVLAGEFAGFKKGYIASYLNTILRDAKRGKPTRAKATFWGFHDYNDLENVVAERQGSKEVIAKSFTNTEANNYVHYLTSKRLGSTHIWLTEQGVKVETDSNPAGSTKLSGNPELQRLAAQDFLRLASPAEHVERIFYYGYRGLPKASLEQLAKEKKHGFDSALLAGEGFGPEPKNWRPAFCVLALGDSNGCPAGSITHAPVAGTTTKTASTVLLDVEPEGLATTYKVEYGTTESYGKATVATPAPNAEGTQSETVSLSSLEPCTTYHYQAEGENEASEGKPGLGGDQTFTTACIYKGEYTISYTNHGEIGELGSLFGKIGTYTYYQPSQKAFEEGQQYSFKDERNVSPSLPEHLKTLTGTLTHGPGTLKEPVYNKTQKYWEVEIGAINTKYNGHEEWRVSLEGEYTNGA